MPERRVIESDEKGALVCNHCGALPESDGDHSCPCPFPDHECPDHQARETR